MDKQMPSTKWITMFDLAIVQTGFMGAVTIVPRKFGLHAADKDLESYVFFWKCVGHQLGIDDKYNLCSLGKAASDKIVWEVIHEVLLPDITNPPPEYSQTAEAYIGGLNLMFLGLRVFSVKSTLAFSYWALGLQRGPLSLLDLCRYLLLRIIIFFIGVLPPYRYLLNYAVRRTVLGNRLFYEVPRDRRACPFVGMLGPTDATLTGNSSDERTLRVFPSLVAAFLLPLVIIFCSIIAVLPLGCFLQALLITKIAVHSADGFKSIDRWFGY
jgi:hypothetical protein